MPPESLHGHSSRQGHDSEIRSLYPLLRQLSETVRNDDDPRIAVFAIVAENYLTDEHDPRFRQAVLNSFSTLDLTRKHRVSHTENVMLRAAQRQLFKLNGSIAPVYPDDYDDLGAMTIGLRAIMDNPTCAQEFEYDLSHRLIQRNVPQRYVSLPLSVNLHRLADEVAGNEARFEGPLRAIDVGPSLNFGGKKIAVGSPFYVPDVYDTASVPLALAMRNEARMRQLAKLLELQLVLGELRGVDKINPAVPGAEEWIWSCSLKPSEWLDAVKVAEYQALHDASPKQVSLSVQDFTDPKVERSLPFKRHSMHVGFISTVLYLMTERERRVVLDNLKKFVKEDGLIIRQDFGFLQGGEYHLYRAMFGKKFQYTTVVTDRVTDRTEEYFRFYDGQAMQVKIGGFVLAMLDGLATAGRL